MTSHQDVRSRLQVILSPGVRDQLYRTLAGALTFLSGWGILDDQNAVLWSQLGVGTIGSLFAMLYATSTARQALYALVGPLGAVLMAYGIIQDTKWAIIVASLGQVFGMATAASKTVELVPGVAAPGLGIAETTTVTVPAQVAVAASTPREAAVIRRSRRASKTPAKARRGARAE